MDETRFSQVQIGKMATVSGLTDISNEVSTVVDKFSELDKEVNNLDLKLKTHIIANENKFDELDKKDILNENFKYQMRQRMNIHEKNISWELRNYEKRFEYHKEDIIKLIDKKFAFIKGYVDGRINVQDDHMEYRFEKQNKIIAVLAGLNIVSICLAIFL